MSNGNGNIRPNAFSHRVIKKRGDTPLRELEKKLEVGKDAIARVEQGYAPGLKIFSKLIVWLDVDAETALTELGLISRDQLRRRRV